jgi:MscS family membrane protein
MGDMSELTSGLVLGNETWRLGAFALAILVALVAGKIGRILLTRLADRLEKQGRSLSAATLLAVSRVVVVTMFAVGLRVGIAFLRIGEGLEELLATVIEILMTVVIGFALYQIAEVVNVALTRYTAKTESTMDDMLAPLVRTTLRITVIVLTLLQVVQTLTGNPLTSILAGLGVGGLAIALAAQETVKHFFGSIVLFTDKPFQVGERIVVDSFDGTVEEVGFRSTRIRTLEGHLVTVPNGDLANKAIRNIGRRPNIRHIYNIGITYDTPPEKVEQAVAILRELLDNHEGMDPELPPKVYFNNYESHYLNLFAIFWYHPPDWWAYNEFLQKLNFEILKRFNAEGIDFAFPTQTLHLAGDPSRPLTVGVAPPSLPDQRPGSVPE